MAIRFLTSVPEKMKMLFIENGWGKSVLEFGVYMLRESESRIPFGHIVSEMSVNH